MLPRPRLDLSGTPGLRPISLSPGSWQTSLGLGSMSRYSAQIVICITDVWFFCFAVALLCLLHFRIPYLLEKCRGVEGSYVMWVVYFISTNTTGPFRCKYPVLKTVLTVLSLKLDNMLGKMVFILKRNPYRLRPRCLLCYTLSADLLFILYNIVTICIFSLITWI